MSYFNYDPFFGDEDDQDKRSENKQPKNGFIDPFFSDNDENDKPEVRVLETRDDDSSQNVGNGSGNGGNNRPQEPQRPYKPYCEKTKRQYGIGLIIAIMIPILVITNVLTGVIMFNTLWQDAKTS